GSDPFLQRWLLSDARRLRWRVRPAARVRHDVSAFAHHAAVSADPDAGVVVRDRLRRHRADPRRHRHAGGCRAFRTSRRHGVRLPVDPVLARATAVETAPDPDALTARGWGIASTCAARAG